MALQIGIGPNNRKSPYFDATLKDGVACFSIYNHMYIPAHFGDPDAEYDSLINGVAMWDVAAQRQVEISGPDAAELVQYLTTRDVNKAKVGQGRYVCLCDHAGNLINDPVLQMLRPDQFWLSIADSDVELWAKAIAAERGLNVQVFEPDVSPLAVQGPKAEDVIADLFGPWIRDMKYFGFKQTDLQGIPLVLARSGWSKQGGFELYLQDATRGTELWNIVKEAGLPYGIRPGAPNDVERIESGLLSYGADCRLQTIPCNPFEMSLGKLIDFEKDGDFVGKAALKAITAQGISRERIGFHLSGDPITKWEHPINVQTSDGKAVGVLCEAVFSPRFGKNLGIGLLSTEISENTTDLTITLDKQPRSVQAIPLPF